MRVPLPALVAACLIAAPAAAHQAGVSQGEYTIEGSTVRAELMFARGEIARLVPDADADRDRVFGEFELLAAKPALTAALAAGVAVAAPGPCAATLERVDFVEEDGLAAAAVFTCPSGQVDALTLRLPLLRTLEPGHRHVARARFVGSEPPLDFVMHARRSALQLRRPTAPAPPASAAPEPPAASRAPTLAALAIAGLLGAGALAWRRRGK